MQKKTWTEIHKEHENRGKNEAEKEGRERGKESR